MKNGKEFQCGILMIATLVLCLTSPAVASKRTVGLLLNERGGLAGYTLFTPRWNSTVYLIDHFGREVHTWSINQRWRIQISHVKLLENGNLLLAIQEGQGRSVAEVDPDGNIVWEYAHPNLHHDMLKLPNGNVLLLSREIKTPEEAIAAGANPGFISPGGLEVDYLVEVQPASGEVVWEWSVWDHLVQDFDPRKPNYGAITEHPELIDINFILSPLVRDEYRRPTDWTHINGIDYHPVLDQIMLSPKHYGELWIIDHSTTKEEAAGHHGGNSRKGGDLLYRWGNPRAYGRGTTDEQRLFWHHNAHWIAPGLPGAGNILIFNNGDEFQGFQRWYSSVDEIVPPVERYGYRRPPDSAYPPAEPVWTYHAAEAPFDFYARNVSGMQRLPNGNTLICDGPHGTFFQVTPEGKTVWKYVNPVVGPVTVNDLLHQGDEIPIRNTRETPYGLAHVLDNSVYRAYWYAPDYPGLQGLDLAPGKPIELYRTPWAAYPELTVKLGGKVDGSTEKTPKTVRITVSPTDINDEGEGTTPFTRAFTNNANVTVTAPLSLDHNGVNLTFKGWEDGNGALLGSNPTLTLLMDADKTLTACYEGATPFLLTVNSMPSGTEITVTPADRNSEVIPPPSLVNTRRANYHEPTPKFTMTIPKGISLIHRPFVVEKVNNQEKRIDTVGELFELLSPDVNMLITYAPQNEVWHSYIGDSSQNTPANRELAGDTGIVAVMDNDRTLQLEGQREYSGVITLKAGRNLVGSPVKSKQLQTVSDFLTLFPGITAIIIANPNGGSGDTGFQVITSTGDLGGILEIIGDRSYVVDTVADETVEITGTGWNNASGGVAASPALSIYPMDGQTPVLLVQGAVVDEITGLTLDGFSVTVKNLNTGVALKVCSGEDWPEGGYHLTFVDTLKSHAARVGDVLEITAQSPSPLVGVVPIRHIVTIDDVKTSRLKLEALIAYEIPVETQLLPNYPNPFNPETWIPFRLAEGSNVTLTIYDAVGRLVRLIEVGHKPAAAYESKSKAIYWNGCNDQGERVASGFYFYSLLAGDFSATRKMLILK